ncbi:unnamed protein product, partial [Meganyctiphanes norvegica]
SPLSQSLLMANRCLHLQHDNHSERMSLQSAPTYVTADFGLLGIAGAVYNFVFNIIDIVTDSLLAIVLYETFKESQTDLDRENTRRWFIITLCLILIPMVIINIFSILWYYQNKHCLGDYCVLHKMGRCQGFFKFIFHVLLLGMLIRSIDIIHYGIKMKKERRKVQMGDNGTITRLTPKGEVHAVLQMVISRDTAMLDMIHSFLQDAPQLIFQIYLLYVMPEIITEQDISKKSTMTIQILKVVLAVMSISWSLVSYQDELRRSAQDKEQLSFWATVVCLIWRVSMIASRVLAIGSFMGLQLSSEDGTLQNWIPLGANDNNSAISFPIITIISLSVHWLIMTIWIHAQNTSFCTTEAGKKRPLLEFIYSCVMGAVHLFSYINVKDTPSRRRMIFFYTITLIENTAMITLWCILAAPNPDVYSMWYRAIIVFCVEVLWVIGIFSMVGYYAFLHPDKKSIRQELVHASWRQ